MKKEWKKVRGSSLISLPFNLYIQTKGLKKILETNNMVKNLHNIE
jgi:hypothetical protein